MITRRAFMLAPTSLMGLETAAAQAAAASVTRIGVIGQSNGLLWDYPRRVTPAWPSFVDRMRLGGDTRTFEQVQTAKGGAAFLKRYCAPQWPGNYWLEDDGSPGPHMKTALARFEVAPPDALLMVHGEQDGWQVSWGPRPPVVRDRFVREYTKAMLRVVEHITTKIGRTVPVFVQRLGPRVFFTGHKQRLSHPQRPGYDWVRIAQDAIVSRPGWYMAAVPTADTPLVDIVHYSDDAFRWIGEATADAMRGRI